MTLEEQNKLARIAEEGSIRHLGYMVKNYWPAMLLIGRIIEHGYSPTADEDREVRAALRAWLHDGQRSIDHANYQHRIAVDTAQKIRAKRAQATQE